MPGSVPQVSEESAESWVDEFTTSGPDFQQAKAAVEVLAHSYVFISFFINVVATVSVLTVLCVCRVISISGRSCRRSGRRWLRETLRLIPGCLTLTSCSAPRMTR